ncbi:hypothetical protein ACIBG5_03145 [Kribbella sp. NPDC050241]|uniref:hypothetical protein n=1 Tax=Kribbella sp. NPDC050241 TaxID=3364115 RepID=UPI0037A7E855
MSGRSGARGVVSVAVGSLSRPGAMLAVYLVFLFVLYLVTADPYKAITLPFAAVIGAPGFAVVRWAWTKRIHPWWILRRRGDDPEHPGPRSGAFTIGLAVLLMVPGVAAMLLAALFILAAVRG